MLNGSKPIGDYRMKAITRIEQCLAMALNAVEDPSCPPKLAGAVRHAIFPGGARIRPQLALAVANACGMDDPRLSEGVAVAIELMHCASLVHDDLPCFDDASSRRGRASVHYAYGEPLAVLTGDALIVLAFQTLASSASQSPLRLPGLMHIIASCVGMPSGIVAGQAWESESRVSLMQYQRAKTGALCVAATTAGALSAGADPKQWQALGDCLGEAYQVADDVRDVMGQADLLGKPVGQDAQHDRPNAIANLGLSGAIGHFESLIQAASDAIPEGPNAQTLKAMVMQESERLVPRAACNAYRESSASNSANGQSSKSTSN
jgi:geranylgeranyl diphosphate synthase type II